MTNTSTRFDRRAKQRAAMTITMVGGTLIVNGQPAGAATFDVTNTNAAGPGSLAQAVIDANAAPGADMITFSGAGASGTIDIGAATLDIDDDLTIVGPGEATLTLTNTNGALLYVYNDASLNLSGLTLDDTNRDAISGRDTGDITISNVTISDAGSGGGFGNKRAITLYAAGAVSITDTTITDPYLYAINVQGATTIALTDIDVNGNTAGFGRAIDIDDATSLMATGVDVMNTYGGIAVRDTANVTFSDLDVSSLAQGGTGLSVGDATEVSVSDATLTGLYDGLRVRNSGTVTISGVDASQANQRGVKITRSDDITLTNVTANETDDLAGNGYDSGNGIIIANSGTITLSGVTANDSEEDGLYITDSDAITATNVTANDNDDGGMHLSNLDTVEATNVTANDNDNSGLYIDRVDNVTLTDITANDNDDGVFIDDSTATLTRVSADGNGDAGVEINDSAVTITEATITDNGVGISSDDALSMSVTDSTIDDSSDAGIKIDGTPGPGDTATISDTTFEGNSYGIETNGFLDALTVTDVSIDDSNHHGVFATDTGSVTIARLYANNNQSSGVYIDDVDSLSITESTISNSGASGIRATQAIATDIGSSTIDGAPYGIRLYRGGQTTIADTTVTGADKGLRVESRSAKTTIESSTITQSGERALEVRESTDVNVVNSTIADNDITDNAVVLLYRSSATIAHSTISDNSTTAGGGGTALYAYNNSTLTLDHTIVSNNIGTVGPSVLDIFISGDSNGSAEHSIVPVGEIAAEGFSATNVEAADPLLGALGDNGGSTHTMFPEAASPALNGGDPAITGEPATDQRGGARVSSTIDIGAVEVDPGVVSIDPTAVSIAEDGSSVGVIVERSGIGDGAVSVDLVSADGTAVAGTDFTAVNETVSWADGDVAPKTVTVAITDDTDEEGDETFTVALSTPVGATIDPAANSQAITITANDAPAFGEALTSLAPQRFVDTRPNGTTFDNQFEKAGKRTAGSEYQVQIAGRGGVPADAVGVIMNVTAIGAESNGFVTAHPCVTPRPEASSLNYTTGVNLGNEVIAGLSASGEVCIFTSGAANITIDVVGFIAADSPTTPITPARVADTRPGKATADGTNVPEGKTSAGSETTITLGGRVGIPADATAAIINVTAINPTSTGFVTVHPCVDPKPDASSLNHVAGVNRGNEIVAPLNSAGEICLFTSAAIDFTIDAVGYIPNGTNLSAVTPARFLDTRPGKSTVDGQSAGEGKRDAGSSLTLPIAGRNGIPATAKAAILNVTAIGPESNGFLTVSPCVNPLPDASSLNYVPGVNGGNEIVAQLDANGDICIFTSSNAHITVDVVAYLDA